MEQNRAGGGKIETLDGLRGIAILLVVWFHTWQLSWLSTRIQGRTWALDLDFLGRTGYIGVELFFFISAACLMLPIARRRDQEHPLELGDYAYRRAIKILPSYWLAIAICLLFRIDSFQSTGQYLWQLFTHLFFIHNLFTETRSSINGVFWSLAVEVQFYVIFPWLARLFLRRPPAVALGMAATALGYRYLVRFLNPADLNFWINQLPGFLDLFAAGMLTAWYLARAEGVYDVPRRHQKFKWTVAALCAVGVILSLLFRADQIRYEVGQPYLWQVQERVWIAACFIVLVIASQRALPKWRMSLANPALVFLSTLSYNLYLWHQILGRELFRRRIPASMAADPHDDMHWKLLYTPLALVASIGFAALLTYAFERPLLRRKNPFILAQSGHRPDHDRGVLRG
jgi:peptidoglycan/LPS O-acetylase OafA/YrhL